MAPNDGLAFSKRCFQRATYTPLRTRDGNGDDDSGDAIAKVNLLQALEIAPGEADRLPESIGSGLSEGAAEVLDVVGQLRSGSALAIAPRAAALSSTALLAFAERLHGARRSDLGLLQRGIADLRNRYAQALIHAVEEAHRQPAAAAISPSVSGLPFAINQPGMLAVAGDSQLAAIAAAALAPQQAALAARQATPEQALIWGETNVPEVIAPLAARARDYLTGSQLATTTAAAQQILLAESELTRRLAAQVVIMEAFARRPVEPIGLLHLERLEMTPADVLRGELVYSVPLAPLERVSITHREWSTYQEEFSTYVRDYFEQYSERGVAQSEDVAMATSVQSRHGNALSMGQSPASADLALGMTLPVATGGDVVGDTRSREESRNEVRQLTERAATRTIKEHKLSFTITRASGTETASARQLRNPHKDQSMQIDYYRRVRRWQSELFRWGVRMTWDLVLPDPGRDLRGRLHELADVEGRLARPFSFDLAVSAVSGSTWAALAATYGATLAPPPAPQRVEASQTFAYETPNVATGRADGPDDATLGQPAWVRQWRKEQLEFDIPSGWEARTIDVTVNARFFRFGGDDPYVEFAGEGSSRRLTPAAGIANVRGEFSVSAPRPASGGGLADMLTGPALGGGSGLATLFRPEQRGYVDRYVAPFILKHAATVAITVSSDLQPSDALIESWRMKAWAQLRDAASARDARLREQWRDRRAVLLRELASTDVLTLRRREREQVMRLVLSWLFPDFAMSNDVLDAVASQIVSGNALPTAADALTRLKILEYGAYIRFVHEAVDWDRLHYILYPYFWDADVNQPAKLFLEHPDAAHREFLRAGAVRVLLPVQPGFEEPFASLIYLGTIGSLPEAHRFLDVADQVSDANRAYGEPEDGADPADVPVPGRLIGRWEDTTPTAALDIVVAVAPVS